MAIKLSLPYIAGLIDGEGCITIFHDRTQEGKGTIITGRFALGMTSHQLVKDLCNQMGGYLYYKVRKGNRRPCMYWQANEQVASKFLKKCLPYLRVKKQQAKLLIALAATRSKHNTGVYGTPQNVHDRRVRIANRCKALNLRGKHGRV